MPHSSTRRCVAPLAPGVPGTTSRNARTLPHTDYSSSRRCKGSPGAVEAANTRQSRAVHVPTPIRTESRSRSVCVARGACQDSTLPLQGGAARIPDRSRSALLVVANHGVDRPSGVGVGRERAGAGHPNRRTRRRHHCCQEAEVVLVVGAGRRWRQFRWCKSFGAR
jgi:hypothetical protein